MLKKAALEIESFFPNETSETYFIPYDTKNKKGPKGKLYTKLINTKSTLKLANASIEPKPVLNKEKQDSPGEKDLIQEDYLVFLRVATEPLAKVFEAWEGSFKLRKKLYLHASLQSIFEDFPCLKLNYGLELVSFL